MTRSVLDLENWVSAYIEAQRSAEPITDKHPLWWAIYRFDELQEVDPKACLAAVLRVVEKTKDPEVLSAVAAGPLEDLIDERGPEIIEELEWQARNDPDFKRLLMSVWECGSDDVWARVSKVRAGA